MADVPAPPAPAGGKGQVQDPIKQALFSLCCFYALYWAWLRAGELNAFLGKEAVKPLFVIIGIFFLPLPFWFICSAVLEAQQKVDPQAKDEKIVDFIICWFCFPFGIYRLQQKLNAVWGK